MPNHIKGILLPWKPEHWSFFDVLIGNHDPIEEWYTELSDEGKFHFDSLLKNLSKVDSTLNWIGFKYLRGKLKDEHVWQLDFRADKRQYRLLGVFGKERKNAVLIIGCYHKGDTYTPHNALETAFQRAKALREGKAGTRERKINFDS